MQVKTMESGLYIPKGNITPRPTQGNTVKPQSDALAPALMTAPGTLPGLLGLHSFAAACIVCTHETAPNKLTAALSFLLMQ